MSGATISIARIVPFLRPRKDDLGKQMGPLLDMADAKSRKTDREHNGGPNDHDVGRSTAV